MILALTCAIFFARGVAISETAPPAHILDIRLEIKPVNMVSPGDATITITISNESEFDADNVYFTSSDGLHAEPLGQIPAGDVQIFTRAYTVSQEELDAGRVYLIVSHDDVSGAESLVNYTVEAFVTRAEPAPEMEFTRRFSSDSATPGSTITIIYRVRNIGNVPLTQIRVNDALGDFTGRAELLDPGQSKLFSSRVTVNSEALSSASASCACESAPGGGLEVRLADKPITVVSPTLSAALTLDKMSARMGDTVNGIIVIAAAGSDFSAVRVEDVTYGTLIADSLSIDEDGVLSVACSWPVRENAEFSVRVTGLSATGEISEAVSNAVVLSLEGAPETNALSVSASAANNVISSKGYVRVTVAIVNSGLTDVLGVTLSESSMGVIREFAFVPAGDPTYREVLCRVEDDTELVFAINYVNSSGAAVSASSAPVSITIAAGGAPPETGIERERGFEDWVEERFSGDKVFWSLLIISSAVLLALVAALILTQSRERRARRHRLAQEKKRKHEEFGRTGKFVPVKKQNRPGGQ